MSGWREADEKKEHPEDVREAGRQREGGETRHRVVGCTQPEGGLRGDQVHGEGIVQSGAFLKVSIT